MPPLLTFDLREMPFPFARSEGFSSVIQSFRGHLAQLQVLDSQETVSHLLPFGTAVTCVVLVSKRILTQKEDSLTPSTTPPPLSDCTCPYGGVCPFPPCPLSLLLQGKAFQKTNLTLLKRCLWLLGWRVSVTEERAMKSEKVQSDRLWKSRNVALWVIFSIFKSPVEMVFTL